MYNYFNGKGTIGFTCDSCGRELNGCSIVNGMKFCAKCYQETFGKDNQQNEIQQLKQQLAEKEEELLKQKEKSARTEQIYNGIIVDKDKEIEKLKTKQKPIVMHSKENYYFLEEENIKLHFAQKQLAITELEKVKILLQNAVNYEGYTFVGLYDAVNNQIKELKGEQT